MRIRRLSGSSSKHKGLNSDTQPDSLSWVCDCDHKYYPGLQLCTSTAPIATILDFTWQTVRIAASIPERLKSIPSPPLDAICVDTGSLNGLISMIKTWNHLQGGRKAESRQALFGAVLLDGTDNYPERRSLLYHIDFRNQRQITFVRN